MTEVSNDDPIKSMEEWCSVIFETDEGTGEGHKETIEEDNPASLARKSLERLTMRPT